MRDPTESSKRHFQTWIELNQDSDQSSITEVFEKPTRAKLMYNFWNILNDNPDYNLKQDVPEKVNLNPKTSRRFCPQPLFCYRASKEDCKDCKDPKKPCQNCDCKNKYSRASKTSIPNTCGCATLKKDKSDQGSQSKLNKCGCPAECDKECTTVSPHTCECAKIEEKRSSHNKFCLQSKLKVISDCVCPPPELCCQGKCPAVISRFPPAEESPDTCRHVIPADQLTQTLQDVNKALSFKMTCAENIDELIETQKQLRKQIDYMEGKEIEIKNNFIEAQRAWDYMEGQYINKIKQAINKEDAKREEKKEAEASVRQWRKNKKNLEFRITVLKKHTEEVKQNIKAKSNKVNKIKSEMEELNKKIEATSKQVEAAKELMPNKVKASNAKIKAMCAEMTKIKKIVFQENNRKREKQLEGSKYAKDAREDFFKLYKTMLQRKHEKEHHLAEKATILDEMDLIRKTMGSYKLKFEYKDKALSKEIAELDSEITNFKDKRSPCNKCVGTTNYTCTDCPRCLETKFCLRQGDECADDPMKCVCMTTKEMFMDNVFNNMNEVLQKQIKTKDGKFTADAILSSLKRSRNGKLHEETKRIVKDFVLTSVKKDLFSTIVGGARKTRCEMSQDAYDSLKLCMDDIPDPPPHIGDKGTSPRKEPCRKWGGTIECSCPEGPKSCPCVKGLCKTHNTSSKLVSCPEKKPECLGPDVCKCTPVDGKRKIKSGMEEKFPCNDLKHSQLLRNVRATQCFVKQQALSPFATEPYIMAYQQQVPEIITLYNQGVPYYGSAAKRPPGNRRGTKYQRKIRTDDSMKLAEKISPIVSVKGTVVMNKAIDKSCAFFKYLNNKSYYHV